MSRTVLALVLVAASATAASAGGYVGLGIGTGAATTGDLGFSEDGRSGRLLVGYRFGRLAIEGLGTRYDLERADGYLYTGTTLAVVGKYSFPLADKFEVFGRGGLQHTSLGAEDYGEPYSGTGFLVGGGVEYRLNLGVTGVSFFMDYTVQRSKLTSPEIYGDREFASTNRMWTLGATLSF